MTTLGIWVAAAFTLAALSLLYKENVVFRFAEHVFVGLAAGQALVVGYATIVKDAFTPLGKGDFMPLIPIILGLALYLRFVRPVQVWARVPLALMIATGAAVLARSAIKADVLDQIGATVVPLTGVAGLQIFNNLVLIVGVLGVLAYFVFTYFRSWSGIYQFPPAVGKWVMMITFGAAFGNAVLGRLSLLVGRVTFLLHDWLGVLQ